MLHVANGGAVRIGVLASGDGWHVRDLARAALRLNHELRAVSFRHLEGNIGAGSAVAGALRHGRAGAGERLDLGRLDCVIVRTMPAGSLEQVIFRMDVLHRLRACGVAVLNPPRALEAAVDKYLACCRLEAAGVPVPRTVACEDAGTALDAFERLGGDVVVKPIFGSEGRGITRVTDREVAYRVFRTLERFGAVLYLQEFVPHEGADLRAFVLGDRVLAAMCRRHASDWRTNVARGARAEAAEPAADLCDLAVRAARAIAAPAAGVDLLTGRDGRTYVLEVNAVPGWRALARATGVDVAEHLLRFAAQEAATRA